jgi:hypothetical protein
MRELNRGHNTGAVIERRFANEAEIERITGISRRTLQKHRLFGRGLPFYRFGRRVLYDLAEVEERIRAGAIQVIPLASGIVGRQEAS